ncbi:MAG: peptide deformylase [Candidatus Omnitrophica bacterium]|nr:peptide deformylase [Candidatus Omnitrophota bacterium]
MAKISILTYPNPSLRKKAQNVFSFDSVLKNLVEEMSEIMYELNGIGLAANQVGSPLNFFIADIGDGLNSFINPEITFVSEELDTMEEGCLSLPGVSANVTRPDAVTIKYNDLSGKLLNKTYTGLFAKVAQHEIDHLRGKIIIDHQNIFQSVFNKAKLKFLK